MNTVIGRSWVYLHLAADGSVLYVGQTYRPQRREVEHAGQSPWWPQVSDTRHFGPYLADHARRLERHLIEVLDPPYNVAHTTRWELHPSKRTA